MNFRALTKSGWGACRLGTVVLCSVLASPPAAAQSDAGVDCGSTLGPGGSYRLVSDVGPCKNVGEALTLEGPVEVDLNEVTVSCATKLEAGESSPYAGIDVEGKRVKLYNGTVQDCEDGVILDGDGHHELSELTITSTQTDVGDRGIRARSDHNLVQDNVVSGFAGEGFRIDGDNAGSATPVPGTDQWEGAVVASPGTVGMLTAVATTADGEVVQTDPMIVAIGR